MIAGGLSVGIGLGLQNMVQNFTSGLSVIFGQTIREGDVVEVGGVTGVVKKINIRNTMLQTYDNAIIFIPNSSFLGGTFTNWTHNDQKARQQIAVGVAYINIIKERHFQFYAFVGMNLNGDSPSLRANYFAIYLTTFYIERLLHTIQKFTINLFNTFLIPQIFNFQLSIMNYAL